jgi:hypothetical protein
VVAEELEVEGSKSTSNDGTSGWKDVEEEDEELAHLDDIENGHSMERIEKGVRITVSNCSALLKILLIVTRTIRPSRSTGFKPDGKLLYDPVCGF